MYRTFLPILLFLGTMMAAPPESNITFVKQLSSEHETDNKGSTELTPEPSEHVSEEDEEFDTTNADEEPTDTTEIFTTTEATTTTKRPKRYRSKAKSATPSFYSKLSYFQKSDRGPAVNLIDGTPGKRRYISKCRCEKIWNCPKLQITVPRCPNEYFLCCF